MQVFVARKGTAPATPGAPRAADTPILSGNPTPRRIARRRVDGVLLLDKPSGATSNAALMRVKRLYNAEKAGHSGTLDPLASGLLPICLGAATRFAGLLLDAPKRYVATVRFGVTTTTHDAEGEIVASQPVALDIDRLRAALERRVGVQMQLPPAHCALKRDGRPYYEYARAGIEIVRVPREIEIHALALRSWKSPDAVIEVACSKGTYVRALAADLGDDLGCGAHLAALRRTATGPFDIAAATTLDELERSDEGGRIARLLPIDAPLAGLPRLDLDDATARALAHGQRPAIAAAPGRYRVYAPQHRFAGMADVASERLVAVRLVDTHDVVRDSGAADANATSDVSEDQAS